MTVCRTSRARPDIWGAAIHHHMTKLLAAHLVKCTVDGNRVCYRVDEKSVSRLPDRLKDMLLPQ